MLNALPVALLAVVTAWFLWPIIVDPIARVLARQSNDEADDLAETFFNNWAKHGRGTPLLMRSDRS